MVISKVREFNRNYRTFSSEIEEKHIKYARIAIIVAILFGFLDTIVYETFVGRSFDDGVSIISYYVCFFLPLLLLSIIAGSSKLYADKENANSRKRFIAESFFALCYFVFFIFSCLTLFLSCEYRNRIDYTAFFVITIIFVTFIFINPIKLLVFYVVSVPCAIFLMSRFDLLMAEHEMVYSVILTAVMSWIVMFFKIVEVTSNYENNSHLQHLYKSREEFLSNLTHEMRSPLNAILGKNQIILRESNEEGTLKLASEISSSGKMLLALINDILDWSKIESGSMQLIPANYDFTEISTEMENIMRTEALGHGIKFVCKYDDDIPSVLYGDEVRIRQIIMNLLSNAIKYTKQGSVTYRIQCVRGVVRDGNVVTGSDDVIGEYERMNNIGNNIDEDECVLRFSVEDTGIGIKEEDVSKLLEKYTRIDEYTNRKLQGTGLGLSITTSLLTLMNSRLEIISTYGVGSVFSFEIKQKVIDATPFGIQSRNKEERGHFKTKDVRILVVDDNRVNYGVSSALLKHYDVKTDYANSGMYCLEKLKTHEYDIIFLDHLMPEMDGVETLKKIQSGFYHVYENTPIIALTANSFSDAGQVYKNYGFADYLSKPIEITRLEKILSDYLPEEKKYYVKE